MLPMAPRVRYTLMVGVILLGGLVVWLVNPPVKSRPYPNPPTGSPPLMESIGTSCHPMLELRDREQIVDCRQRVQTYQDMIDLPVSQPYEGRWLPYEPAEPELVAAAERLWQSGLLESLWVDVKDYPYANGVVGRNVHFHFIEREGEVVVPDGPPRVPESYAMVPSGTARIYPR